MSLGGSLASQIPSGVGVGVAVGPVPLIVNRSVADPVPTLGVTLILLHAAVAVPAGALTSIKYCLKLPAVMSCAPVWTFAVTLVQDPEYVTETLFKLLVEIFVTLTYKVNT